MKTFKTSANDFSDKHNSGREVKLLRAYDEEMHRCPSTRSWLWMDLSKVKVDKRSIGEVIRWSMTQLQAYQ